jgi:ADP-heptose:LPS heptosyltransferase
MLGQPEYSEGVKELLEAGVALLTTPEVKDAVDLLSSARCVVSVDTGLMHIAVQQGTPTICLFQDPIFYRPAANGYALLSKHCEPVCVENRMAARPEKVTEYPEWNWQTSNFKFCKVPEDERCINSITVDQVIGCFDKLQRHFLSGRTYT